MSHLLLWLTKTDRDELSELQPSKAKQVDFAFLLFTTQCYVKAAQGIMTAATHFTDISTLVETSRDGCFDLCNQSAAVCTVKLTCRCTLQKSRN